MESAEEDDYKCIVPKIAFEDGVKITASLDEYNEFINSLTGKYYTGYKDPVSDDEQYGYESEDEENILPSQTVKHENTLVEDDIKNTTPEMDKKPFITVLKNEENVYLSPQKDDNRVEACAVIKNDDDNVYRPRKSSEVKSNFVHFCLENLKKEDEVEDSEIFANGEEETTDTDPLEVKNIKEEGGEEVLQDLVRPLPGNFHSGVRLKQCYIQLTPLLPGDTASLIGQLTKQENTSAYGNYSQELSSSELNKEIVSINKNQKTKIHMRDSSENFKIDHSVAMEFISDLPSSNTAGFKCTPAPWLGKTVRGKKIYHCNYCSYANKSRSTLVRHIRVHTGERPYKCDFCLYKCSRKGNLTVHMRCHTGEKRFNCSQCSYKSAKKDHLVVHFTRNHTKEKPYQCQFCTYKSATKGQLTVHTRIHTGVKPYHCKFCSFECCDRGSFVKHVRIHTGDKRYHCTVCSFRCSASGNLKSHMYTHSRERPYQCEKCLYRGVSKYSLKSHTMRVHTAERVYHNLQFVLTSALTKKAFRRT